MSETNLWRLLRRVAILCVLTAGLVAATFGPGTPEVKADACCDDCRNTLDFCIYLCDDSQQGWRCWQQCEENYRGCAWSCTNPPGCGLS